MPIDGPAEPTTDETPTASTNASAAASPIHAPVSTSRRNPGVGSAPASAIEATAAVTYQRPQTEDQRETARYSRREQPRSRAPRDHEFAKHTGSEIAGARGDADENRDDCQKP